MITTSLLRIWHNELNNNFFHGELSTPSFQLTNNVNQLGQFRGRYNLIKITTHYNITDSQYREILIHEMVHQWQWETYHKVDHGYTFRMKANELNCQGWHVSRLTSIGNVSVNEGKEKAKDLANFTYLFVWTTNKGMKLFRHARPTCVDKLKRLTHTSDFYNNVELYKVAYTTELKKGFREAVNSLGGYDYYNHRAMIDRLISEGIKMAV